MKAKVDFWRGLCEQVQIWALFFTFLLALAPTLLVLALFFAVLRTLLSLYLRTFKPSFGPFLSGVNNFFSKDSPYEKPRAVVLVRLSSSQHITMDEIKELVHRKFAEFEQPPSGGQPWYPELQQYPTSWMGFAVMKKEANFQVADHLTKMEDIFQSDLVMTPDTISEMTLKLSRHPFKRNTSPWQFVLWHNKSRVRQEKGERIQTIGFVRMHHTLGDGLSLVKLVSSLFDLDDNFDKFLQKFSDSLTTNTSGSGSTFSSRVKSSRIRNFGRMVWHKMSLPILGLYEFSAALIQFWDQNEWHQGWPKFRHDFYVASIDSIPIARIKRIRRLRGGIRFSTVITAALSASIRKFMMRRGLIEIPPAIHASVAIPIPKRSHNLSNNVTSGFVRIPTGLNRRSEMLQEVEETYDRARAARYPAVIYAVMILVNTFPKCLLANYWIFTTAVMSNVPALDGTFQVADKKVTKIHGFVVAPDSTAGIYVTTVGYDHKLFLNLTLSRHIVKGRDGVKEICEDFLQELDALEDPKRPDLIL